MPDSRDYKSAMEKVSAGQRWKQATLEKIQAETAAQKASRPRRTIPFGRRAIPLATAAAICLLVIPATARSLTSVSGGATAADQASPRVATRQMPENSAAANNGAVPFALAAAPETAMAEAPQDTAAAPACTTVDADSPEAALPMKYRQVIYLHYIEGYSTAEIAALLGLKQNTVLSQLSRGRALLKDMLKGDF